MQLGRAGLPGQWIESRLLLTNRIIVVSHRIRFKLYTALVLVTVGLTGCFLLVVFAIARPSPDRGRLVAAIGLAFGTLTSYWLTFFMFFQPICWLTCLLWLVTEFTQRPSWLLALGLAFRNLFAAHDGLSANRDSLSLYIRRLWLDQNRANAG